MYLSTPGIMLYGSRCKAAEFIGDKQTHKQTYKHSTFFTITDVIRFVHPG